jgi:hypothetical protein
LHSTAGEALSKRLSCRVHVSKYWPNYVSEYVSEYVFEYLPEYLSKYVLPNICREYLPNMLCQNCYGVCAVATIGCVLMVLTARDINGVTTKRNLNKDSRYRA